MGRRLNPFELLNSAEQTSTTTAEDQEAEDALRALAGHACSRCGKTLSRARGYGCCDLAHCPICGAAAHPRNGCEHLVATRTNRLALLCGKGGEFVFPAPPRWAQWNKQVWAGTQLRDAYGTNYDMATTVFGPDFNRYNKRHFRKILLEQLTPDICTTVDHDTRRDRYWFSHNTAPNAKQVFQLLTALRRANTTLHRLKPLNSPPTNAPDDNNQPEQAPTPLTTGQNPAIADEELAPPGDNVGNQPIAQKDNPPAPPKHRLQDYVLPLLQQGSKWIQNLGSVRHDK